MSSMNKKRNSNKQAADCLFEEDDLDKRLVRFVKEKFFVLLIKINNYFSLNLPSLLP